MMQEYAGLAPGVDMTLIMACAFLPVGLSETAALMVASFSALPLLILLSAASTSTSQQPWTRGIVIGLHPFTLALFLSGLGWAALGFYGLWRLFADLQDKPPHQGLPLAGLGIGGAFVTVPDFTAYLFPLAAMVFVFAPKPMVGRHMRVFYLLCFTPVLMIAGGYAYSAALFGVTAPPSRDFLVLPSGLWGGVVAAAITLLVAPGLARPSKGASRRARLAALLILGLTGTGGPVMAGSFLAAGLLAQEAISARFAAPVGWSLASYAGSILALFALDHWAHLA